MAFGGATTVCCVSVLQIHTCHASVRGFMPFWVCLIIKRTNEPKGTLALKLFVFTHVCFYVQELGEEICGAQCVPFHRQPVRCECACVPPVCLSPRHTPYLSPLHTLCLSLGITHPLPGECSKHHCYRMASALLPTKFS